MTNLDAEISSSESQRQEMFDLSSQLRVQLIKARSALDTNGEVDKELDQQIETLLEKFCG